jgi:hypothetical protein
MRGGVARLFQLFTISDKINKASISKLMYNEKITYATYDGG